MTVPLQEPLCAISFLPGQKRKKAPKRLFP